MMSLTMLYTPILNSQGEEELSDTVHLENIQKMRQREHKRINILTDEMDGDKSRRKRICSFSIEQELEIKVLLNAGFKNKKKCSQLIAIVLGADNTYTAAQVLYKLRQLGHLAPQANISSTAAKHSGDNETIKIEGQSEEETLQAIKERDVLVRHHESEPAHTDGHEASGREDVGIDSTYQQYMMSLINLEDSGDDVGPAVSRNMGSRRKLKMVIDAEDDE